MSESRLVYSTGGSNNCPSCGKPLRKCRCKTAAQSAAGAAAVKIQRESKGRGGKQVTVIVGLAGTDAEHKKTLKQLKSLCGSGGTVKSGQLEIQGDHREAIKSFLESTGYSVKLSGG